MISASKLYDALKDYTPLERIYILEKYSISCIKDNVPFAVSESSLTPEEIAIKKVLTWEQINDWLDWDKWAANHIADHTAGQTGQYVSEQRIAGQYNAYFYDSEVYPIGDFKTFQLLCIKAHLADGIQGYDKPWYCYRCKRCGGVVSITRREAVLMRMQDCLQDRQVNSGLDFLFQNPYSKIKGIRLYCDQCQNDFFDLIKGMSEEIDTILKH